MIRRNHDAPAYIPLEYRTAKELRATAEHLRTAADANTHSMQVWTDLLALAAHYDTLADQVADCSGSGAPSSRDAPDARWQGQYPDLELQTPLLGERQLRSTRFLPASHEAAAETKASQEVIELVRLHRELGLLVIQLRDAGQSWSEVKALIEDKIASAHR